MQDFLNKIRQKSESDRTTIAASVAGGIVLMIFLIWTSSLSSRLGSTSSDIKASEEFVDSQEATVLEAVKRKAGLLFGEGSPLEEIDFKGFSKPIEYKSDNVEAKSTNDERDLDLILQEFNDLKKASSSPSLEDTDEEQNSENSF